MPLNVTLANIATRTFELEVTSVTWTHATARAFGQAEINIPRNSPAFSASYVNEDGGSSVTITDGVLGTWRGVVLKPVIGAWGMRLSCIELMGLGQYRHVAPKGRFRYLPAGAVVRQAFFDAFGALARSPLQPGGFCESEPLLPDYKFTGQTFAAVLSDLMDDTGQEWRVDTSGLFHWGGQTGSVYAVHLCDDGDVIDGEREADVTNRVAEVIARGTGTDTVDTSTAVVQPVTRALGGEAYVAQASEVYGGLNWPRQEVIAVPDGRGATLSYGAQSALARQRNPAVTYTFKLRRRTQGNLTVNACTNGEFETNTTGWNGLFGTETLTQDLVTFKNGAAALNVALPAASGTQGAYFQASITGPQAVECFFWFKGVASSTYTVQSSASGGSGRGTDMTVTASGDWQPILFRSSNISGDTDWNIIVRRASRSGTETFYLDGVFITKRFGADLWTNVREGDYLQVVLPYAGISGACVNVRVRSRTYREGSDFLDLEVAEVARPTAYTPAPLLTERTIPVPPPPRHEFVRDVMRALTISERLSHRS